MKKKKRPVLFTIAVNLLFIAAIAAVGWKIWDYVQDSRQTTELAEELWEQAVITAAPASAEKAEITQTVPDPATDKSADNAQAAADTATAERTDNTQTGAEPATAERVESTQAGTESSTAETAGKDAADAVQEAAEIIAKASGSESAVIDAGTRSETSAQSQSDLAKETEKRAGEQAEVQMERKVPEVTPAPEGQAKSGGEGGSAFLKMLNTTATPEPTPRFTDMPDLPVGIDFEKLAKSNRDVAAWLYHPGMGINLPVVHGSDNEYYLERGFNRNIRQAGTLFIDYRNKGDFSDRKTIIYGHARRDLTMFGKLHYYKKAEYCEEHPFFYLYVPGHRYRLEIVATGYTKDASDYYELPAGVHWDELLDRLMEQSPYDFGIPISPEDHYVMLSTCAYDYHDERWLVVARIDDPEGTLPALTGAE